MSFSPRPPLLVLWALLLLAPACTVPDEDAVDVPSTPEEEGEPLSTEDLDGDGYSPADGDCDDDDPARHPGAEEVTADGIDQNCNGFDAIRCHEDLDGDGIGGSVAYFEGGGLDCSDGTIEIGEDCDDEDASIHPGADELCDGIDSDCDGDLVDEHDDVNGNGVPDCEDLPLGDKDDDGYSPADGDCDDTDPDVHPGAEETSGDGIDQDCNGADAIRCYEDDDEDGVGGAVGYFDGGGGPCDEPYTEVGGDCDDDDDSVHPGATEACDEIDSDCDEDLLDGEPDFDEDGEPDCIDPPGDDDDAADDDDSAS